VFLSQGYAEDVLQQGTEANSRIPQKSSGKFGIEKLIREKPNLAQTRQVL
jgi:hypothetical protein